MAKQATTPKTECACGCGADMLGRRKSIYRQGHDARHVSQLVKAVVSGELNLNGAKSELATAVLRDKLAAAVDRAVNKAKGKKAPAKPKLTPDEATALADEDAAFRAEQAAAQAAKQPEWGDDANHPDRVKAKVGRWTYEGRVELDPLAAQGQAFIFEDKKGNEVRHTGAFTVI